ncbi:MAG: glycosyltransferase family 2 protein [Thermaerobacter sp.]|nr:glycosyltransferase family 2 protein [Thermaerobacter sp.]
MRISVVVPVYNEETGLRQFFCTLHDVLRTLGSSWEVLFVDDGSADDSWVVIQQLASEHAEVKGIRLSRNFGHQMALTAGLEHVSADAVITMDADLQHPPELIPELVARWQQGFEVVNTVRTDAAEMRQFKRRTSALFYRLINKVSEVPIPAGAADFRLLSRQANQALLAMPERHRFLRGMVSWIGFSQTFIPYTARPRQHGESKYTLRKMMNLGADGLTSFSVAPLRLALLLGLISIVLAFLYAVYVLWVKIFTHNSEPGWTSIIGVSMFFGGVQLFTLGILGEYLGQLFGEIKRRPLYVIAQTAGSVEPSARKEII